MRRRTLLLAAIGAAGVLAAGCESRAAAEDPSGARTTDGGGHDRIGVLPDSKEKIAPEKLGAVGDAVHLRFPPGSRLVEGRYYQWQEWSISARVAVPAAAFDGFVEDNGLPEPLAGLRPERIVAGDSVTSKYDPGWRPARHTTVSGIEDASTEDVYRVLMFGFDDPGTVEVFLIARDA